MVLKTVQNLYGRLEIGIAFQKISRGGLALKLGLAGIFDSRVQGRPMAVELVESEHRASIARQEFAIGRLNGSIHPEIIIAVRADTFDDFQAMTIRQGLDRGIFPGRTAYPAGFVA